MFLLRVFLLGFVSVAVALGATKPTVSAPSVAAGVNGTLTNGAVTISTTVTANGAPTEVVFEYGLTPNYGKTTAAVAVGAAQVAANVSTSVRELAGGRTWHFRATAKNQAGQEASADTSFLVPPFDPTLSLSPAEKVVAGQAKLRASITANGIGGSAFIECSTSATFLPRVAEPQLWAITPTEETRSISAKLEGLTRGLTHHYRFVFRPTTPGADVTTPSRTFFTNQAPVAKADTFGLRGARTTRLDVLQNDQDADNDALQVTAVSSAAKGTVTRTPDNLRLTYTPGRAFRGTDSFTYTITDPFPSSTATATVTIRSFGTLLAGNQGGLLRDANGEAVGYFKITTSETGAFSGSVLVNGEKKSIAGTLGTDGTFRGTIEIDGRAVPVALAATQDGTATTLDVDFDDGRWVAELPTTEASPALRESLAGRYTVEFPTGSATSDAASTGGEPTGTGWAALKLGTDGVARIKGRLPDGRSYSARGVLGATSAGGVVTFFDDPRRTRVAASLTIGSTISGTLNVQRHSGGSGLFSEGYGTQSTANGARYVQPARGKRAIEGTADASGRRLTFSATGSNAAETFTRNLRVDENDRVEVTDRDSERLKVKIDPDSGRFTASFTGATNDRQIKGTGVFIQGTSGIGRGAGVFTGDDGTGKITITAGSRATPATPTTEPVVTTR